MDLNNKAFLKDFVKKIKNFRTPTSSDRNYGRFGNRQRYPVKNNFTLEEINKILREGSPEHLRELSRHYYRISGVYRGIIDLHAEMSKYHTMLTPIFENTKTASKNQIINTFNQANNFIESLHIPVNFAHITRQILLNGVYYGILRQSDKGFTFQDLPIEYCRARYKDENDLEILEFNITYFDTIREDEVKQSLISGYPIEIQNAYKNKKKLTTPWIELTGGSGGVCFSYGDRTPAFAASIPNIYRLDKSMDREAERDENELYKLLIQKMPIDNKGELVFQMDEVEDLHESVAEMLYDTDTVNVLTTFGDTKLESLQDSTAATQSSDRINKYVNAVYNELGVSKLLFNCDTAAGIEYSIKRSQALVNEINNKYSIWITYLVNKYFSKPKYTFAFEILPIDIFNQKEVEEKYFQAAQYGYSKMYAGVALGIKQRNQISLLDFENDILDLSTRMVPLQSSYTSNVMKEVKNGTKSDDLPEDKHIINDSDNKEE